MISSLLILSATLVASPVFISEVKATREAGHLRVDVIGDGGIDPELARTKLDDDLLLIYLGGARVRADNRSWALADGKGEIRAHRHRGETELVVPIARNGCAGPVELTGSATGISALVGCEGRGAGPAPASASASASASARSGAKTVVSPASDAATTKTMAMTTPSSAGRTSRDTSAEKKSTKSAVEQEQLKALIELPRSDSETPPAADGPGSEARRRSAAPPTAVIVPIAAPGPRPAEREPLARVSSATSVAQQAPAPGAPVSAPTPAASLATASRSPAPATATAAVNSAGSLRAVAVPAFLLAGLALAAFLIARRRRVVSQRHIQILETTSLGPKRSLILARVGDDTLILASSEAGITLLKSHAGPEAAKVAASPEGKKAAVDLARAIDNDDDDAGERTVAASARAPDDFNIEISQPLEEALADIPQPTGGQITTGRPGFRAIEGGLAGLFRSRIATIDRAQVAETFDDVLEDSVEDQELRRKLAAGMSARAR